MRQAGIVVQRMRLRSLRVRARLSGGELAQQRRRDGDVLGAGQAHALGGAGQAGGQDLGLEAVGKVITLGADAEGEVGGGVGVATRQSVPSSPSSWAGGFAWAHVYSPLVEMHAQLVDVRRDVAAPHLRRQRGLLEREQRRRERADVVLALELLARLQPFPGAGDLDADARRVEGGVDVLEERDHAAGAGDGFGGAVGVEWVGLDVDEAGEVGVDLQREEDHLGHTETRRQLARPFCLC